MALPVGERVRRARRNAGMTLQELAGEIGVSPATLSRAETGQGRLGVSRLEACALALGMDVDVLAEGAPAESNGRRPEGLVVGEGAEGRWRHYGELRLPAVLQAALDNFLQLGYHGSSVREIASLANLSVPGLYHHHASKHDLLVEVMNLTMMDFSTRCRAAAMEGTTSRQRFLLLVECYALFHSYRRELAFIGASEMRSLEHPHRQRIVDIRLACQHMVDHEVRALVAAGEASTPWGPDAARAVVTMLVGIANWYQREGLLTPEEIAERYRLHASALIGLEPAPSDEEHHRIPEGQ